MAIRGYKQWGLHASHVTPSTSPWTAGTWQPSASAEATPTTTKPSSLVRDPTQIKHRNPAKLILHPARVQYGPGYSADVTGDGPESNPFNTIDLTTAEVRSTSSNMLHETLQDNSTVITFDADKCAQELLYGWESLSLQQGRDPTITEFAHWIEQRDPPAFFYGRQAEYQYESISPDGLCGGHACVHAMTDDQAVGHGHTRSNTDTRAQYAAHFTAWIQTVTTGWPDMPPATRLAHLRILNGWLQEFQTPGAEQVNHPAHVQPDRWFSGELLQLIGQPHNLRLWTWWESTNEFRLQDVASGMGGIRLSHIRNATQLAGQRHYGFKDRHFFVLTPPPLWTLKPHSSTWRPGR